MSPCGGRPARGAGHRRAAAGCSRPRYPRRPGRGPAADNACPARRHARQPAARLAPASPRRPLGPRPAARGRSSVRAPLAPARLRPRPARGPRRPRSPACARLVPRSLLALCRRTKLGARAAGPASCCRRPRSQGPRGAAAVGLPRELSETRAGCSPQLNPFPARRLRAPAQAAGGPRVHAKTVSVRLGFLTPLCKDKQYKAQCNVVLKLLNS